MPEDDYFPPLPGGGGGGGGLIGAAAARRTNSPQHQQQGMRFQHSTSSSISSPTTPTGWGHHHHQQQQQQQQQLPNYNHRPQLSSASILSSSSRRLSTASHRFRTRSNSNSRPKSLVQTVLTTGAALARRFLAVFLALPPIQKALVVLALALALGFALVFLIYSHALFAALGPLAAKMRASSVGWVPVSLLIMATGFPPLIGYSTAVTIAGFVYGFPWGWPLAALSTVVGSTAAFLTSRGFLKAYVHGLVGKDKRFVALGQVLRRDGIGVLAMIRLCPLPYSLSNGFLATIGSIGPGRFAAATALTTPKLLVHVFIGSRLALLAESGDKMTGKDKMINYASMLIGGAVGFTVGLLIYRRTMARAAELAAAGEGGDQEDLEAGNGLLDNADGEDHHHRHAYNQSRQLVDPDELDAAHIMNLDDDDDDISLWDTTEGSGSYHDAWDGDGDGGGGGSETVNGTGIMAAAMKKKDMNGGIR